MRSAKQSGHFLDGYLPYLLGHASHVMNKDFDAYAREAGLSPVEWRALASLSDCDGLTIGELCRKVVAQQPTLTKAVKRLHALALVRREDDAVDLRKTRVYETPRGRALAVRLIKAAKAHEAEMVRHLTKEQLKALKAGLREILARRRRRAQSDGAVAR